MQYLLIIFSLITISLSQNDINEINPCSDKMFLELKETNINDMSDREYEYFIEMSKNCSEYQTTSKMVVPDKGMQTIRKVVGWGVIVFFVYLVQFF